MLRALPTARLIVLPPVPLVAFDARDAHVPMPHGSGIYARRLAQALRERARDELDYWFVERGGRGPELWFEQVSLPRLLRRRRPALVHTPNCFLPLRRPCPGVVTVHDLAFEAFPHDFSRRTGWKYRTFTRRAVRSAERVICDSRFTADDVCERYGADADRVRVVPLAPALDVGDSPSPPGPYVLAVGDLRPKKNLDALVGAWRELRAAGLEHRLVLAGRDFGEGPRLRELASAEPLELPGFVSDAEVDALLRGADLFVHPGLYEGFGMIAVEAMARGCPVALARAGALPETGGDAAAYFDPNDAGSLAAAIREVVSDPSRRAQLAARGRERAAGLSWAATAEGTVAVYRELL
jgi:glycosyltransferase involved in cell wall biosynthesis